jgi:hypothetical protein
VACIPLEESGSLQAPSFSYGVHDIILSCLAVLLFVGQGFTGARDLLEIPLIWQKAHIQKCDFQALTCPK